MLSAPLLRKVVHSHSQEPFLFSLTLVIRMQEPWSDPTTVVSVELEIGLWNVSRSPGPSPVFPTSVTWSVTASSITVSVVAAVADDEATNEAIPAGASRT